VFRTTIGAAWAAAMLAGCGGADGDVDLARDLGQASTAMQAAASGPSDKGGAEKSFTARMLDALNAARAVPRTCGATAFPAAEPLAWHPQAEQAALAQAQYLQRSNQFSHAGENGSTIGDRMTATGYAWQSVGENLAAGYVDFAAVLQGWLDSPGHCANVMNASFVDVGVVLVQGAPSNTYRSYWAMALGRPR
jgi:uncharacterized protein YkwD